jgi:hypothetical protein
MKVMTGAECSGMSRTWRPLRSRRYSSMPPSDLTWVKPSTETGAAVAAAVAKASKGRRLFNMGGAVEEILSSHNPAAAAIGRKAH